MNWKKRNELIYPVRIPRRIVGNLFIDQWNLFIDQWNLFMTNDAIRTRRLVSLLSPSLLPFVLFPRYDPSKMLKQEISVNTFPTCSCLKQAWKKRVEGSSSKKNENFEKCNVTNVKSGLVLLRSVSAQAAALLSCEVIDIDNLSRTWSYQKDML